MLRVLVADDHEVVRKGLMKVLAETLQPVKVDKRETDGRVARAWKGEYDLVVLDLKMPGKSGLDALKGDQAAPAAAARRDPQQMHPEEPVRYTGHARRRLRIHDEESAG